MSGDDIRNVMRRLQALWPRDREEDHDREWIAVLKPLDHIFADKAVNMLRDTLMFPPTVADFKSAYYEALAIGADTLALPPGDEVPTRLRDIYGENQKEWVYCWRCDMALTLGERDGDSGYDGSRGFYHRTCPRNGSAPLIPASERTKRNEYFDKHHIGIGPHITPMPYQS